MCFPLSTALSLVFTDWGDDAGASKVIIIPRASMTLCVTTEARDAMSELAGIFCAAFWCRARFTFSRNIETSKVIDLEKFVSHGDLDPIY